MNKKRVLELLVWSVVLTAALIMLFTSNNGIGGESKGNTVNNLTLEGDPRYDILFIQ